MTIFSSDDRHGQRIRFSIVIGCLVTIARAIILWGSLVPAAGIALAQSRWDRSLRECDRDAQVYDDESDAQLRVLERRHRQLQLDVEDERQMREQRDFDRWLDHGD